jgi:hypothetical protein
MWNREILQKEIEENKNELCLNMFEVVELLNVFDWEDDYYYVIRGSDWERVEQSCVCRLIFLKNQLSEEDYTAMKNWRQQNVLENL